MHLDLMVLEEWLRGKLFPARLHSARVHGADFLVIGVEAWMLESDVSVESPCRGEGTLAEATVQQSRLF